MKDSLKLYNFLEAKERLDTVISDTSLIYSQVLSEECENEVYLKPENLQKTGSFKIRGAYNKIIKLNDEEKKKGVITSSAGNHAQGVAYSAQKLGIKAIIVMPLATPIIKVDATKSYGAEVVLHGDVYDDAYAHAVKLQKEKGYVFVHPFDDIDVIEGQGTIALEILHEIPDMDVILVPIGGGGLISGVAAYAKLKNPNIKIIGVEPSGAASAIEAMKMGCPTEISESITIADGTAVKKIGNINCKYISKYVDDIITISDYELMDSFLLLAEKHKIIAENSGILSVAATKKLDFKGKKVCSILSGGNIDVMTISSMIDKGLIERGRIFTFVVDLRDKPGEMLRVVNILAKHNANIVRLDHNKYKNLNIFQEVELIATVETGGFEHIEKITRAMAEEGFNIRNYI